eukprot:TRINITY_DN622_c0_g1_i10.p1 TRINITY_DN622_c0_g1~~TRINITY_DN622_c0_g1_i10.p1  ORF type:complete len:995 (-),score=92.39 TRINITY_DN622_c0_g1_i10:929-3808(-)
MEYSRIMIRDLVVGQTHRNKVFRGKIIEWPVVMQDVHTIVEDLNGDVIQVSIHNLNIKSYKQADKTFKVGYEIAVYDPFMKAFLNGGIGIRVDNSKEIYVGPPRRNFDTIDYHAQGNQLFKDKDFASACEQYSLALQQKSDVAKVFGNIAACLLKIDKPLSSLAYACISVRIDNSYEKGWHRVQKALEKLDKPDETKWTLQLSPKSVQKDFQIGGKKKFDVRQGEIPMYTFITTETLLLQENKSSDIQGSFEDLKTQGNEAFRNQDYILALSCYLNALELENQSISMLMRNRAACSLQLGKPVFAAMDSCVSLLIQFENNDKAIFRKVQALRELGQIEPALQTIEEYKKTGIKLDPILVQLAKELRSIQKKKLPKHRGTHKGKDTIEDGMRTQENKSVATGKQQASMEQLRQFMPQNIRNKVDQVMFDTRVTNFHQEYMKGGHLPPQCDRRLCDSFLLQEYQDNLRASKRLEFEKNIIEKKGAEGEELLAQQFASEGHITKRLGDFSEKRIKWWSRSEPGSVNLIEKKGRYLKELVHSFSNTWGHPITLTYGMTHVAIGYVDFTTLINAKFCGSKESGPLQFIGYEQSIFSTAKFQVITKMMIDGINPKHILQIWYSAGWSNQTLQEFRNAITQILRQGGLDKKVEKLLRHWLAAQLVPLSKAQKLWLNFHPGGPCLTPNFVNKKDRIEMTTYTLTGRLLECDVGSITMFANPANLPHIVHNESVTEQMKEADVCENYDKYKSVLQVFIGTTLEKIRVLSDKLRQNEVKIDLRVGTLSEDDQDILSEVKKLQADTMSWSNLVDYFGPKKFHPMAKACSGHNTVHYIQSLNWVQEVRGVLAMDYPFKAQYHFYERAKMALTDNQFLDNHLAFMQFPKLPDTDLLKRIQVWPPIDNPWNVIDSVMTTMYSHKWIEVFLEVGGIEFYQIKEAVQYPYSIYSKSQGCMFISYTYDGTSSQKLN